MELAKPDVENWNRRTFPVLNQELTQPFGSETYRFQEAEERAASDVDSVVTPTVGQPAFNHVRLSDEGKTHPGNRATSVDISTDSGTKIHMNVPRGTFGWLESAD